MDRPQTGARVIQFPAKRKCRRPVAKEGPTLDLYPSLPRYAREYVDSIVKGLVDLYAHGAQH